VTLCALALSVPVRATDGPDSPDAGSRVAQAEEPPTPTSPTATPAPPPARAGSSRQFDVNRLPFIPVPEIDVAPNAGLTIGVIPVILQTNDQNEITQILAPDLIHSQYFGWGANYRILGYPSADTQWALFGGLKERVERDVDARYADDLTRSGPFTWSAEAQYDRSGVPRFYGLGNGSLRRDETNYVSDQGRIDASFGVNLNHALQVSYSARFRLLDVLPGVLPGLPSTRTFFPNLEGLGTNRDLENRLMVTYDTRDSLTIPREGGRVVIFGGVSNADFGSSADYTDFGADARHYWPIDPHTTVAWHSAIRYLSGSRDTPFWALSSLGGDRSMLDEREPLRAYPEDRFIDRNLFSTSVEVRHRMLDIDAFGTHLDIEVAPFIDTGKVFTNLGDSPVSHLHTGGGLGFRGVARPYVVGYVDIGYGAEGASIFSGIDYPF
jgi:hypothetical protein